MIRKPPTKPHSATSRVVYMHHLNQYSVTTTTTTYFYPFQFNIIVSVENKSVLPVWNRMRFKWSTYWGIAKLQLLFLVGILSPCWCVCYKFAPVSINYTNQVLFPFPFSITWLFDSAKRMHHVFATLLHESWMLTYNSLYQVFDEIRHQTFFFISEFSAKRNSLF